MPLRRSCAARSVESCATVTSTTRTRRSTISSSNPSMPTSDDIVALLLLAIKDPRVLQALGPREWERLLACARRNAVLAYLAHRTESTGVHERLPDAPRVAMASARAGARRLAQLARWEVEQIAQVM